MNRIILTGRLARDLKCEVKNEKAFSRCTLACNSGSNTDFIDCIAFDKIAELLEKYTKKGDKILIEGRLSVSSYYVSGDTNPRKSTTVIINTVEFLEKKESEEKINELN